MYHNNNNDNNNTNNNNEIIRRRIQKASLSSGRRTFEPRQRRYKISLINRLFKRRYYLLFVDME